MGRELSLEEKNEIIARNIATPEGRYVLGQTIDSNVALNSNIKMKSSLYAGKSENSPLLSSKESENVRDADNQQGRIDNLYKYLFPSETIREQSSVKEDYDIVRTTQRCVEVGRNSYPPEETLVSTCLYQSKESNKIG
jgi:hypothetical protein